MEGNVFVYNCDQSGKKSLKHAASLLTFFVFFCNIHLVLSQLGCGNMELLELVFLYHL